VDTFLLKKHKSLGELTRIKIGHDNSGACSGAMVPCDARMHFWSAILKEAY
jgi:hypothetical protein